MSAPVALLSAVYGGYDKSAAVNGRAGCPAYLYTDEPMRIPGWRVKVHPDVDGAGSDVLRAKWWKLHPFEAVDADVAVWVDGNIQPNAGFAQRCVDALGDDDVAFMPHPWRDCVYTEADVVKAAGLATPSAVDDQMGFYRHIGHPANWGLFASGVIAYRRTDASLALGRHWWHEVTTRTSRDQLSLPVLVRIMQERDGLKWNTNLSWGEGWTIRPHGQP